ncbi:hypothetical protein [Muricoccus radiodurans]|uniref:hypothetical protein n=1 Tax=Muricoccus radiodurans TaxID=2231721 RepID=UPI003CF73BC6
MRLVLLHGIGQEGLKPQDLQNTWVRDLESGMGGEGVLARTTIDMPFYGDALIAAAALTLRGAVAQGAVGASDDHDLSDFLSESLQEQAEAAGIAQSEIAVEQDRENKGGVVSQSLPMNRRINAIVSLLERISPLHGDLALRLLGQAHAYLKKPHVRDAVDAIVRPALASDPLVVVAHSLGTIVGFRLLREHELSGRSVEVPLFVTLGSPLTLSTVQRAIGPPLTTPSGVRRWINVRDPDDFISLNRSLGLPRFSGNIENISDFKNTGATAHSIPGYLSHPKTATAIAEALGIAR